MKEECLRLLKKWEQKIINPYSKRMSNCPPFNKEELTKFADFLECHCYDLTFNDITSYDILYNCYDGNKSMQQLYEMNRKFTRFSGIKKRLNIIIKNKKYVVRATKIYFKTIPKIEYKNNIKHWFCGKMTPRKGKLLLIKDNKEHDFCGYVCRFLIKDYTKFKNDLLLYLLKEI